MANSERASSRAPTTRAPEPSSRRRGPPPMTFTPAALADARRRYEQTQDTIVSIAAALGTSERSLQRIAASEGWERHLPPPRDATPAARLLMEVEALEKTINGQGATLPPQSGGEGRFVARQRDEPGWGPHDESATPYVVDAPLPPTPNPSPQSKSGLPDFDHFQMPNSGKPEFGCAARAGGGEERVATPEQDAASPAPEITAPEQDASSEYDAAPEDIAATIDRLLRAVTRELAAVEAMRAEMKNTPQRPRDALATAQALVSLTETVNKLQRMRCGLVDATYDNSDDECPRDLDEFRLSLARRIDAFVASRLDDGDAERDDDCAG